MYAKVFPAEAPTSKCVTVEFEMFTVSSEYTEELPVSAPHVHSTESATPSSDVTIIVIEVCAQAYPYIPRWT